MNRWKIVLIAAAAVVVLIVVFQNTAEVETKLLFVTITMPRAVLLLSTALLGFVLGMITAVTVSRNARAAKEKGEEAKAGP